MTAVDWGERLAPRVYLDHICLGGRERGDVSIAPLNDEKRHLKGHADSAHIEGRYGNQG